MNVVPGDLAATINPARTSGSRHKRVPPARSVGRSAVLGLLSLCERSGPESGGTSSRSDVRAGCSANNKSWYADGRAYKEIKERKGRNEFFKAQLWNSSNLSRKNKGHCVEVESRAVHALPPPTGTAARDRVACRWFPAAVQPLAGSFAYMMSVRLALNYIIRASLRCALSAGRKNLIADYGRRRGGRRFGYARGEASVRINCRISSD